MGIGENIFAIANRQSRATTTGRAVILFLEGLDG